MAVAIIVAGLAALASYFGSPIPQSLLAKSQIYGTPGPWVGRHWWDWLSPFILGRFSSVTETGHLFLLSVVFTPALVLGARALWAERTSPLLAFIGACLAVWLGYALLGVAFFWWYLAVPLAGLRGTGGGRLPAARAWPRHSTSARGLMVAGAVDGSASALSGARAERSIWGSRRWRASSMRHAQPGQKVMLEPIGIVGFQDSARRRRRGRTGLAASRAAAPRGPGWYADVAARERPDWLVVRAGDCSRAVERSPASGARSVTEAERDSLLDTLPRRRRDRHHLAGDNRLMVLKRWR